MSDFIDYEDIEEDEISAFEDVPKERNVITGSDAGIESIAPDTPIYRLRLLYSHETFLAVCTEDNLVPDTMVIVPTRYGRDLAQVISSVSGKLPQVSELAWIVRVATSEDLEKSRNNSKLEKSAFIIFWKNQRFFFSLPPRTGWISVNLLRIL
jgi:hypothetical protein